MKRLLLVSAAALVMSSSSGCCLLDSIFCWHNWGCCGAGWGCEPVPPACCASERIGCQPCDCCGNYTGPSHDYHGLNYGGGYGGEPVWQDGGVIQQGEPTPAETVPAPPRTSQRMSRPPYQPAQQYRAEPQYHAEPQYQASRPRPVPPQQYSPSRRYQ